jgi:predicted N-acetyltransferase YhbS
MEFVTDFHDMADDIVKLFETVFSDSEGPEAGHQIKDLVQDMLTTLSDSDIYVVTAVDRGDIRGAIIFTPMHYPEDPRRVYILSPVAVATDQQGKGLGQRLINHGLEMLRDAGVDVALTYGDPNFYSKVGFKQITEAEAQAPQTLQFPHGWLGQSLSQANLKPLIGPAQCVAPLDHPALW